ncbi:MAG: hypothetical protein CM1200mP36_06780 [Gammaproteobacteria bacterium]|nr:MAG: hypothetical protein CM1200mP36_06780 [Gammaproteobacteria bacterium]
MLERHGVGRGELVVGNEVTVVGHLSRYGRNEMIAGYIKMPGGEQIVLWSGLFGGLEANESETDRTRQLRQSDRKESSGSGVKVNLHQRCN